MREAVAIGGRVGLPLSELARRKEDGSGAAPALKVGRVVRPLIGDAVAVGAETCNLLCGESVAQFREDQVALDGAGAQALGDGSQVVEVALVDCAGVFALGDGDSQPPVVMLFEDE